jgi:transposase-like protein
VHQALVQQGQVNAQHVQADEIRVKGRKMIAWMGLAIMASTRLWMAGVVSVHRDAHLADRLLQQVRACGQPLQALLVCTDGWAAYVRRFGADEILSTGE